MHVTSLKVYIEENNQEQMNKINPHVLQTKISDLEKKIQINRKDQIVIRGKITLSDTTEEKNELNIILEKIRREELPLINEKFEKEQRLYELEQKLKRKGDVKETKKVHFEDEDDISKQKAHKFIEDRISYYVKSLPGSSKTKGRSAHLHYEIIRLKIWNEVDTFIKSNNNTDETNLTKIYRDELNKLLYQYP